MAKQLMDIRTWAKAQGLTSADHGRFSEEVKEAYAKANARALQQAQDSAPRNAQLIELARQIPVPTIREYFTQERQEKAGIKVGARGRLTDDIYLAYAKAKRLGQTKARKEKAVAAAA
jgi:hypothetical protein